MTRHAANHLQLDASASPAAIAKQVVQAVRDERQREARANGSVWLQRLNKTYVDAASAYEHAMNDEKGIDAAAKFLMVAARFVRHRPSRGRRVSRRRRG
jgi:hypothetical protein